MARVRRLLAAALLLGVLAGCAAEPTPGGSSAPPTPSAGVLRVNGATTSGTRLRVTLPSIKLLRAESFSSVQLMLALADRSGTYSYALYPANRAGESGGQFDLSQAPLDVGLSDESELVKLWILALHNTRYAAAERYGIDALAARLALGFRGWIEDGSPQDDPLAAVVSASDGALYEWFAGIEVVGQEVITLRADDGWGIGLASQHSPDGGLSAVYTVQILSSADAARLTTPTPTAPPDAPGPAVLVDETFAHGASPYGWYEGERGGYVNRIVDGAYQIRLTDIGPREFALSWGSLEGARFANYRAEAQVRLVDGDPAQARTGVWFNYQDDYNFLYFGVSGAGEYRAAVILRNANALELQDWTPHPAVRPGLASNTLTVEARSSGEVILSINGTRVLSFRDQTFTAGSVAFFCYAKSVPAACQLEQIRITALES